MILFLKILIILKDYLDYLFYLFIHQQFYLIIEFKLGGWFYGMLTLFKLMSNQVFYAASKNMVSSN